MPLYICEFENVEELANVQILSVRRRTKVVNAKQLLNALSPMLVATGKSAVVKALQRAKALFPMLVTPGKSAVVKAEQP